MSLLDKLFGHQDKWSIMSMSSIPEWVIYARRYVVTQNSEYINKAIETCKDDKIRKLLKRPDVVGKKIGDQTVLHPADLMVFKPFADNLRANGRKAEAAIIEILGLFGVAMTVEKPEQYSEIINMALSACNIIINLCQANNFHDCETHFMYLLGKYAHKIHDYKQAKIIFDRIEQSYQALASDEPDIYLPKLAYLLDETGVLFTDIRNFSEAKIKFDESAKILRDLANINPSLYKEKLASTLNNQSTMLGEARRFVDAKQRLQEAIAIQRKLANNNPSKYKPHLASMLNNLVRVLTGENNFLEAFQVCQECLAIKRELAKKEPSIYMVGLGDALINMSELLGNLCEIENEDVIFSKLIYYCNQAVSVYSELTKKAPNVWGPNYAKALNNLGNILVKQERLDEAKQAHQAAAIIYQKLAKNEAEACVAEVAMIMNNLTRTLELAGENFAAINASKQAVLIAETVNHDPDRFLAKGRATFGYIMQLRASISENNHNGVYRSLAALREGRVRASDANPADSLEAAVENLSKASRRCGREIRVVIAQYVPENSSLLAVLQPNGSQNLKYDLVTEFVEVAKRLFEEIRSIFFKDIRRKDRTYLNLIRDLGKTLWESLPDFLQETLDPRAKHDVLISGDSFWNNFPWEALCFDNGEIDFLGLSRPLPRWDPITAQSFEKLRRITFGKGDLSAAIICPWNVPGMQKLNNARREAEEITRLLSNMKYGLLLNGKNMITGKYASTTAIAYVLKKSPSLIHYTGHGGIVDNEEVLILWNANKEIKSQAFFGKKQIRDLREENIQNKKLLNTGPLVVLNSCMTGNVRYWGGQREDLSAILLEEGAEAIIASPMPVFDAMGMMLGSRLYDISNMNSKNKGMAQHFSKVRNDIEEYFRVSEPSLWPAWTLLHYHGNPYARLPHILS